MANSQFDQLVQIEQLRHIEQVQALACDNEDAFSGHSSLSHSSLGQSSPQHFTDRLWLRAQSIVRQHDLTATLAHAAKLSRYLKFFTLLLAAVLGAMAAFYAVTDANPSGNSSTINIYWLLLVLLGFNVISMLLWLIGIGFNLQGLASGMLARLSVWLSGILAGALPGVFDTVPHTTPHTTPHGSEQRNKLQSQADRAWVHCQFSGGVGKWQFSNLTHQLWLVYLCAGLLALVLLLMVRQYDFVWGTTLLSDAAFTQLTDVLSRPLEAIGFNTPTVLQVQESRLGSGQLLKVEYRTNWAQFLLGAILCFGILPRALLLLWSSLMSLQARKRFKLDLYLPYYVSLRQRLMPMTSPGQIVDADTSPPQNSAKAQPKPASHSLPENTQWVALELGNDFTWPMATISPQQNLGEVVDRQTLALAIQAVQQTGSSQLAVAVEASRSPDRGIQRSVGNLVEHAAQRWLVLLQQANGSEMSSARLAAWYRLAEACNIPADHVINLIVGEPS